MRANDEAEHAEDEEDEEDEHLLEELPPDEAGPLHLEQVDHNVFNEVEMLEFCSKDDQIQS